MTFLKAQCQLHKWFQKWSQKLFTLMHGSLMKNTLISPNTVKFCFFDGSSADREVVVIPYNDSDLIVLKKGDIKACHYDTKSNLVNLDLWYLSLEEVGYQKVTFELNSQSRSLSNELRSEVYLFLDFCTWLKVVA